MGVEPDGQPAGPGAGARYEVGVALRDLAEEPSETVRQTVPGYDDALGERASWGRHTRDHRSVVGERGAAAVQVTTEALAGQIAAAAQRIASSIERQPIASPTPGHLGLDSIEVSFGVTFTGGMQWLFTAEAESSAQVTITLARRPPAVSRATGASDR